ncbi:MAG: RNA methyltransferase, partial [Maribacter sp.]
QENSDQIKSFLNSEEGKDFSLDKDKKIYASKSGFDGFYMALLTKSS